MNGASSLSLRAFGKAQSTPTSLKMGLGDQNYEGPDAPDVYNKSTMSKQSFYFTKKQFAGDKPIGIGKSTIGSIYDDQSMQPGMGS